MQNLEISTESCYQIRQRKKREFETLTAIKEHEYKSPFQQKKAHQKSVKPDALHAYQKTIYLLFRISYTV